MNKAPKTIIIDRRTNKAPAKIIHDEIKAMQSPDHGQQHPNTATDPDNVPNRFSGLPDGWRWAGSKVVPTPDAVNEKLELVEGFVAAREDREAMFEMIDKKKANIKKLHESVKGYFAQLLLANEYAASGFVNNVVYGMVNSVHFYDVYERQLEKLHDASRIDEVQIKQAESHKQALIAACTLDAVLDYDDSFAPDLRKTVVNFLNRQGEWVKDTFGQPQNKAQHKRNSLGGLTGRFQTTPRTPDQELEASEAELDEAFG